MTATTLIQVPAQSTTVCDAFWLWVGEQRTKKPSRLCRIGLHRWRVGPFVIGSKTVYYCGSCPVLGVAKDV